MADPTWEQIVEEDRRLKAERKRRAPEAKADGESERAKALSHMVEVEERHAKDADLERADGIRDNSAVIQAVLS